MKDGSGSCAKGLLAALAGALLLAGCALFADPGRIQPGTPVAEVLEQLGRPSARLPLASGGERLQYSYQPAGQRVYDIDVDATGRVVRVEQVLDEALFGERIQADQWTRADVLREYGPPAEVRGVRNFDGEIWVWRYLSGVTWRLLFIDIDRAGIVRGWSVGDEYLPDLPEPR